MADSNIDRRLSRRQVLRLGAAGLGLIGLGAACAPAPAAPANPADTSKPGAAAQPGAAAPAAAPAAVKPAGVSGQVTLMLGLEPTTLDVQADSSSGSHIVVRDNVVETLVAFDDAMKIVPGLALSWESVEPTRTRFKLRQGVKFHNGEPFNASAITFAIKRINDPATAAAVLAFMDSIAGAEAVDDSPVDHITKTPDPILPRRLTYHGILAPKATEAAPNSPPDAPIGTGPYRLTEWTKGQRFLMTAYDEYAGERKPTIKEIVFLARKEPNVRVLALKAGEAHLIDNVSPEDAATLPKEQIFTADATECPTYRCNTKSGILTDVRIRQAMSHAVDRATIIKEIMGGFANIPNGQLYGPTTFGYDTAMRDHPFDLAKATQLIKDAGAVGKTVTVIGNTAQRWLKDREVLQAMAAMIEKTGLKIDLKLIEYAEYLKAGREVTNPPMDVWAVSVGNDFLDADRPFFAYFRTGGRLSLYNSPELDKVLDASRTELDPTKREALIRQVAKQNYEDAAIIPIAQPKWIYGINPKLKFNVLPTAQLPVNRMTLTT
jgi:peptide/nickel transport system substrate-binding protein